MLYNNNLCLLLVSDIYPCLGCAAVFLERIACDKRHKRVGRRMATACDGRKNSRYYRDQCFPGFHFRYFGVIRFGVQK